MASALEPLDGCGEAGNAVAFGLPLNDGKSTKIATRLATKFRIARETTATFFTPSVCLLPEGIGIDTTRLPFPRVVC